MSKLILDTNVLIYGLDAQSSFHASAVTILTDPAYELLVPTKVISEFFAVCSKLSKTPRITWSNFSRQDAKAQIEDGGMPAGNA